MQVKVSIRQSQFITTVREDEVRACWELSPDHEYGVMVFLWQVLPWERHDVQAVCQGFCEIREEGQREFVMKMEHQFHWLEPTGLSRVFDKRTHAPNGFLPSVVGRMNCSCERSHVMCVVCLFRHIVFHSSMKHKFYIFCGYTFYRSLYYFCVTIFSYVFQVA